jgi:hypothetical protein
MITININNLWYSDKEDDWLAALKDYWKYIKPSHLSIEQEFVSLNPDVVRKMNPEEWYEFLLKKYFFWKYTAPNRYATTTAQLKKHEKIPNGLSELFLIKENIFDFDKEDIAFGLKIANSIKGLGTAGASGLLAVLFPTHFGTVDQFVVKSLLEINSLPERSKILSMKPEQLNINDAFVLIEIMRQKAKGLNQKFNYLWTPRKIDMILWSIRQ